MEIPAGFHDPLDCGLQLRQPLTAAERTAFTDPYQRLLGGAAGTPAATATTLTLETRRPGALPPAVLNLAFPPPDNAFPAAARPWLRPGLLPRLGPRSPLRAAVAREVPGAKTSLEAALRLTRWAGPAAPRHGRSAAALLVAALRAVGLPARLAFGLLYVGSVATEHTWAEVNLGPWLPLDPEVGGVAGAAHLRLAVSPGAPAPSPAPTSADTAPPERDPRADWRQLRDRLRGLKVRLLEAVLATGFHFVPGNPLQFQVRANVLQDRVWNLVVRRPLFAPTTRFVLPGPRDDFVVRVVGTQGELRLTLHIYAASAAGLDARVFAVRGYRPRKIGRETYIVKTTASGKGTLKRTYVQFACAPGPWAARIVRFTLVARGVTPTAVAALEKKTLGTFQQLGRTAQITSCPRTARRVAPRPAAPKPAAPLPPMRPAVRPTVPMRPAARPTVPMRPATRPSAPRPRPARPARRIAPRR